MRNICRPFTIYSDFLPPAKDSRTWEYLSFGYFDGVDVGDNLFQSGSWDMEKMWHYTEGQKQQLNGTYTEQTVFGFRTEMEEERYDEQFWNREILEEYPFLFLVLLQDAHRGSALTDLWRNRRDLEGELNVGGLKAISYLTLDSSDLLLVLACKEYSVGAALIDSFHVGDGKSALSANGWELCYSYSIPSVRKNFLNKNNRIEQMQGVLDSVFIHVIEKEPGSIENIYQAIVKEWPNGTEKKAVLGCNDDLIILRKVPWKIFLRFYRDKDGILNHSNPVYHDNIIGVTTILGEIEKPRMLRNALDTGNAETLSGILRKKCKEMSLEKNSGNGLAVRKELLSILNSLEKYERTPFHDYIFLSALKPIKMLMDMVIVADKKRDGNKYYYFYSFLTSFNLYAQNSVRSDRQFTEVPDFNIRIYDTPAKLNALYNAIIYELKNILNEYSMETEGRHDYEFLTCPGVVSNMQVREVYPNSIKNKRLFLVDIPEKQVFSPKLMLTMLSHEISHFVGSGIRLRDYRCECVLEVLATVLTRYLYDKMDKFVNDRDHLEYITGEEYWLTLRNEVAMQMKEFIKWESKDEFIQERFEKPSDQNKAQWKERLEQYAYHSNMLKLLLEDYMSMICQEQRFWEYPLKREFLYQVKCGKSVEDAQQREKALEKELRDWTWKLNCYTEWNPAELSVKSIIDRVMYLFKECFADLGAVLLLNLSVKDYLDAILFSAQDQGMTIIDLIRRKNVIVRGALLCYSMIYVDEDGYAMWTENELKELAAGNGELGDLAAALWNVMNMYKNNTGVGNGFFGKDWNFLYNRLALEKLPLYLKECRKSYEQTYREKNMTLKQQGLLNIFNTFSKESVEQVIADIQEYIDAYRNRLIEELERYKLEGAEEGM